MPKFTEEQTEEQIDEMSNKERYEYGRWLVDRAMHEPTPDKFDISMADDKLAVSREIDIKGNNDRFITENNIPVDDKSKAARFRAHRAHMMRKLKRKFTLYEEFSIEIAAMRCATDIGEVRGYLEFESRLPGSLIVKVGENRFQITSAFY